MSELSLEQVWRDEWGRLLALLVAHTRRLDLAEDALAEAFERAARTWPQDGMPSNPSAWLLTAARRTVIDRIRGEEAMHRKRPLLVVEERKRMQDNETHETGDELLKLVLLAAHPSLAPEAGSALTLRLVLGISTADIARLFLVSETTMAARLTRARKKVITAGIPFALPKQTVLAERLETVAQVAYLAFTAGYAPTSGPDVTRAELAGEAIRLVRLVRDSSPLAARSSVLHALLALMLLQHARRDARSNAAGDVILLADQDRSAWRRDEIDEALALIDEMTTPFGRGGAGIQIDCHAGASYLLQALIAAEHVKAARATDTDWIMIAGLYYQLEELTGSPVVRLNRAVAVAEAAGPEHGLELLQGLDDELPSNHRLPAVRAALHVRRGDREAARASYRRAIELCDNEAERRHFRTELGVLGD